MASPIAERNPATIAFRAGDLSPVAVRRPEITDEEFWHAMLFGMLVGIPLTWLVSLGLALAAGIGLGVAAAIGIVPALFCGTFYGGLAPLMRRLDRLERAPLQTSQTMAIDQQSPAEQNWHQAA